MAGVNHPGGERTDFGDESVSELVQRASRQTADLIRQELRLAQTELKEKGRRIGMGAGLVGAGGLVAFYGGATLVGAAVLGVATALEPWLAALIVGAALVVIGGILALVGRRKAAEGLLPTPPEPSDSEAIRDEIEQTREELGETIGALSAKTDVKAQASAKADEVKRRARDVGGEVKQRGGDVAERVRRRPAPVIVGGIVLLMVLRLVRSGGGDGATERRSIAWRRRPTGQELRSPTDWPAAGSDGASGGLRAGGRQRLGVAALHLLPRTGGAPLGDQADQTDDGTGDQRPEDRVSPRYVLMGRVPRRPGSDDRPPGPLHERPRKRRRTHCRTGGHGLPHPVFVHDNLLIRPRRPWPLAAGDALVEVGVLPGNCGSEPATSG